LAPETTTKAPPAVRVDGLCVDLGGRRILHDIDLLAPEETITLVVGHNGTGKTTLLRTIVGLHEVASGSVAVEGDDVTGRSAADLVRRGVALVPQTGAIFPNLDVEENLAFGLRRKSERAIPESEVFEMFPILADRRSQLVGTMSGGQRQMVAVARALVANPKILLLDEPSVGLQPNLVDRLLQTISEIRERYALTVVLVEQNIRAALRVSDRITVLNQGRVVHASAVDDVDEAALWRML
jgi:ABC-type branched-subunit amino acid transport system ATPase component